MVEMQCAAVSKHVQKQHLATNLVKSSYAKSIEIVNVLKDLLRSIR